jgi:hypothetical protein
VDPETGAVRFVVDAVGMVEADIDLNMLLTSIRGQPVQDALAYMSQALPIDSQPKVAVDPEWMNRIPWMTSRISVVQKVPAEETTRALSGS